MADLSTLGRQLTTVHLGEALRRLMVLRLLRENPRRSQHRLAEALNTSGATVNKLVRRMADEGLLHTEGATNRTISYHVTAAGEQYRRRLLGAFSTEVIQLYGVMKRAIAVVLADLARLGVRRVALFGAAETAEVVLAVLDECSFELIAVVDNDPARQGVTLRPDVVVQAPRALDTCILDAVLIGSYAHAEAIERQLAPLAARGVRLAALVPRPHLSGQAGGR